MPAELSRKELFKQVWQRPMTKVAASYGISDVALKKICDKHRIPVPGRGYWAKVEAGKRPKRAHFRETSDPKINQIVIRGGSDRNLPEEVKVARAKARTRERQPENKIEVRPDPESLHADVQKTRKKLDKARPSDKGLVLTSAAGLFDVEVGADSLTRAMELLDAIVKAALIRGYEIIKGEESLALRVDGEVIGFKLTEQTNRTPHEPTNSELAAIARWEKRQQRRRQVWEPMDWTPRPDPPEWDYLPNGRLQLVIKDDGYWLPGLRRTFADGKSQRVENLLNRFLEACTTRSAAIKAKRSENERRRKEQEEQARIRKERRRQQALERKRVDALSEKLDQWRDHRQVLELIAAVEARLADSENDDPSPVREWVSWARDYAARIDPLAEALPKLLQFSDFSQYELER